MLSKRHVSPVSRLRTSRSALDGLTECFRTKPSIPVTVDVGDSAITIATSRRQELICDVFSILRDIIFLDEVEELRRTMIGDDEAIVLCLRSGSCRSFRAYSGIDPLILVRILLSQFSVWAR